MKHLLSDTCTYVCSLPSLVLSIGIVTAMITKITMVAWAVLQLSCVQTFARNGRILHLSEQSLNKEFESFTHNVKFKMILDNPSDFPLTFHSKGTSDSFYALA